MEHDSPEYIAMADKLREKAAENIYFAFCHGIRLALAAHGKSLTDPKTIRPIYDRMDRIVQSPRASLVTSHDDNEISYELFTHLRKMEAALCGEYLDET